MTILLPIVTIIQVTHYYIFEIRQDADANRVSASTFGIVKSQGPQWKATL